MMSIFCDTFFVPKPVVRCIAEKKRVNFFKEGYLHQIKLISDGPDTEKAKTNFFENIYNFINSAFDDKPVEFYEMKITNDDGGHTNDIENSNSNGSSGSSNGSSNGSPNNNIDNNNDNDNDRNENKSLLSRIKRFPKIVISKLLKKAYHYIYSKAYKDDNIFDFDMDRDHEEEEEEEDTSNDSESEDNLVIKTSNKERKYIEIKNISKIEVQHVFKSYTFDKVLAVTDISFTVNTDEVFAIVGEKGAGKSTLMKMIYGRISSGYGDIIFDEEHMNYWNWISISKNISIVPKEDFFFFNHSTVSEHIKFYSKINRDRENGFKLLRELNFKGKLNDKIEHLDPPEKTKVKTVIALLKHRNVLVLEEPTVGMSEEDRIKFWEVIQSRTGISIILFSTESLEEANDYATSMLYLKKGEMMAMGSKERVLLELEHKLQIQISID
ncbi:hypothetical protein PIROE2DRAFT_59731 [Piromyces sp. E2]|nr:hypothetical protein PIROE2DRAFT_59731 [Piromyces sp. E2]|eukprot:OUM65886.1 hypothetical protein PIROE2DRAFT_59731 [Piromyces sp. E2]